MQKYLLWDCLFINKARFCVFWPCGACVCGVLRLEGPLPRRKRPFGAFSFVGSMIGAQSKETRWKRPLRAGKRYAWFSRIFLRENPMFIVNAWKSRMMRENHAFSENHVNDKHWCFGVLACWHPCCFFGPVANRWRPVTRPQHAADWRPCECAGVTS